MPTFHRMLRALFPVHTRRGLLVVTLSLQAVILAIGLLIVFDDIRHRVALRLEDRILEQNTQVAESLAARHSIIIGLAKLAESRDTDTGEHLERIARYTELLARNLDLGAPWINDRWIEQLKLASSLHDIGKVGIPDSVLLKPGKLTPEERTIMETHAAIGAETLQTVRARLGTDDLLTMSVEVARSHHERWDGRGYPDRIAGEAIPLAARIVALADVYDALTSARVYKAPMSHSAAVAILREGEGTHFDPQVVRAFNRVERAFDRVREELQPGMPLLTDAPTTQPARLAA